jgi:hypothetical protein
VSGLDEVAGHGRTHDAEADETDLEGWGSHVMVLSCVSVKETAAGGIRG